MPQTGGKDKSSSKRHFTVVIGTKEHGLYCSSSPSSAARKAVSKLFGKKNGKKVEFCLREITQGSKKKTYGPYLGHIEKLSKPIQLKGRLVERKPVVELLKEKSRVKKGGMRGGGIEDIEISLGSCGRSTKFGFWKNGCITLTHGQLKVVLYYNEKTGKIEIRYFDDKNCNVYNGKEDELNIENFNKIILYLLGNVKTDKRISANEFKQRCSTLLRNDILNENKIKIILDDNFKLIQKIILSINNSNLINIPIKNKLIEILDKQNKQNDKQNKLEKAKSLCRSFNMLKQVI